MKKTIIIISIIALLIIGTLIIKPKIKYQKNITVSLNQTIYDTDNLKLKNAKINQKKLIDTSKIGTQEVQVEIKSIFNTKKTITYKVTVEDKEKPTITFNKEIEVIKGSNQDLLQGVSAKDNSNEPIEVKIIGNYDINKVGDYKLYLQAVDSSGNEAKEEFTLKVIENQNTRTFTTLKGYPAKTVDGMTYVNGYLIVNKSYSIPEDYNPGLNEEVSKHAKAMFTEAATEGLNIYISSGFRSYDYQKGLYERYVKRDGVELADTYSARPGHSEHQTGLSFDVNQVDDTFDNTEEAKWLADNCYKYGFILRYPKGTTDETGYQYESWHYRYVGTELAKELYNNGDWITLESYFGLTSQYNY